MKGSVKMKKELIQKIIDKNGITNQLFIAVEECAELQQAISKCYRNKELIPTEVRENLIEEMADVMICLEQLKVIFHINEEALKCWIEAKENRLSTREGLKE